MLDNLLKRLVAWSAPQFWTYLAIFLLLILEAASLVMGNTSNASCLVSVSDYTGRCPSFHEFVFAAATDLFKGLGHEWLTAISTVVIAFFTATLWWSTRGMLRATNESIRLATTEFISSHRPRMRLKHIWLTDGIMNGEPVEVNLDVVNFGDTVGVITNFNYDTFVHPVQGTSLPQRPPYNEESPRITFQFPDWVPLASGVTYPRTLCDGRRLSRNEIDDIRNGTRCLYFVGSIEYRDAAGVRQTAWCRYLRFDEYPPRQGDKGRFEKDPHPDYEYQD